MLPRVRPVKRYWTNWLASVIKTFFISRIRLIRPIIFDKKRALTAFNEENRRPKRSLKVIRAVKSESRFSLFSSELKLRPDLQSHDTNACENTLKSAFNPAFQKSRFIRESPVPVLHRDHDKSLLIQPGVILRRHVETPPSPGPILDLGFQVIADFGLVRPHGPSGRSRRGKGNHGAYPPKPLTSPKAVFILALVFMRVVFCGWSALSFRLPADDPAGKTHRPPLLRRVRGTSSIQTHGSDKEEFSCSSCFQFLVTITQGGRWTSLTTA